MIMSEDIELFLQTLLTTSHLIMTTIVKTYILNQEIHKHAILITVTKSRGGSILGWLH